VFEPWCKSFFAAYSGFHDCLFLLCNRQEDRDWSEPKVESLNPGHIGPRYSKNVKGGEEDESKLQRFGFFTLRLESSWLYDLENCLSSFTVKTIRLNERSLACATTEHKASVSFLLPIRLLTIT
jgi:hypothetical protein